jgi:hypothetical protein
MADLANQKKNEAGTATGDSSAPATLSPSRGDRAKASLAGLGYEEQAARLAPADRLAPGEPVQMKPSQMAPGEVVQRLGQGQPMDGSVASRVGAAYGANLGDVRVHTSPEAQRMTASEGARAVTIGSDVMFAGGQYQPNTPSGDALLAHELAHVVQQSGGGAVAQSKKVAPESSAMESDADQAAIGAMVQMYGGATTSAQAGPSLRSGLAMQRCSGSPEDLGLTREQIRQAAQYGNKQMVEEIFVFVFGSGVPGAAEESDAQQMAAEMMDNLVKGSRAMDYVPRPTGDMPGPLWLFTEAVKAAWRIGSDRGIYSIIRTATASKFAHARRELANGLSYTSPMWR